MGDSGLESIIYKSVDSRGHTIVSANSPRTLSTSVLPQSPWANDTALVLHCGVRKKISTNPSLRECDISSKQKPVLWQSY